MEIKKINPTEIVISGHIIKTENYFDLRNVLNEIAQQGAREVKISIPDSVTITSSVIGLFLRLVNEEHISISLHTGRPQLYELLNTMNMLKVFNVVQVQ